MIRAHTLRRKSSSSSIEELLIPSKTMKEETKEWSLNKRRDSKRRNIFRLSKIICSTQLLMNNLTWILFKVNLLHNTEIISRVKMTNLITLFLDWTRKSYRWLSKIGKSRKETDLPIRLSHFQNGTMILESGPMQFPFSVKCRKSDLN